MYIYVHRGKRFPSLLRIKPVVSLDGNVAMALIELVLVCQKNVWSVELLCRNPQLVFGVRSTIGPCCPFLFCLSFKQSSLQLRTAAQSQKLIPVVQSNINHTAMVLSSNKHNLYRKLKYQLLAELSH
jgi:hypothetical protein